jgi:CheY-like chemotaxis protein
MRVLFADDQIPSASDAENAKYKQELGKELAGILREAGKDFESAYREDYEWLSELLRYLSKDMGFDLVTTNSFAKAKELSQQRDRYDLAVIDLSWTGDPALEPREKKNAGLEILRIIHMANEASEAKKPIIALSQNYKGEPELFATVLETGALPVPKDYTPTGHRTLGAAIKFMSQPYLTAPARDIEWDRAPLTSVISKLTVPQVWKIGSAVVVALAAYGGFAYGLGSFFAKGH